MNEKISTQLPLAGLVENPEARQKSQPSAPMAGKAGVLKRTGRPAQIIGKRFGRLIVESLSHRTRGNSGKTQLHWNCRCDCGGSKVVTSNNLMRGYTGSCGCAMVDRNHRMSVAGYRHGHATGKASSTYNRWCQMIGRCTNPDHPMWKHYGARGIAVCDEWLEFPNFLRDMGEAPRRSHLDRIDNNAGYSKQNCRWASYKTSGRNKRTCHMITFNGQTKCVADWADDLGIKANTIRNRIARGFPLDRLLINPNKNEPTT